VLSGVATARRQTKWQQHIGTIQKYNNTNAIGSSEWRAQQLDRTPLCCDSSKTERTTLPCQRGPAAAQLSLCAVWVCVLRGLNIKQASKRSPK
jgi:hypothetical protein